MGAEPIGVAFLIGPSVGPRHAAAWHRSDDRDGVWRAARPGRRYRAPMRWREFFSHVVDVVEAVGAAVLVLGGLGAFVRYGWELVAERGADAFGDLRKNLGRVILLGLEVLIIADIIRTIVVDQSIRSVTVLGIIVIIRVVLSFSLEVEIDGMWPWNKWRVARDSSPSDPAGG
jgi:uncharacterized membrane protein